MTEATNNQDYADDYDEYDDEDERGLSGFSVLIIGLVMIGAFASVVFIAYKQGMKVGQGVQVAEAPYVAADPDPVKIESAETGAATDEREVYDIFDASAEEPPAVLAEGPEEPVDRFAEDTIAAIASSEPEADEPELASVIGDRVADRAQEDAEALEESGIDLAVVQTQPATPPTPASAAGTNSGRMDALSGSHVVQVGAYRSLEEAEGQWGRMETRMGTYITAKTYDVERADLGDRGVYHRLRVGPFSSKDAAATYCVGLKERGQDCLVKSL
ncbi:MAG: SPOR domain-containing protein [Pseudomonadota bacterium]